MSDPKGYKADFNTPARRAAIAELRPRLRPVRIPQSKGMTMQESSKTTIRFIVTATAIIVGSFALTSVAEALYGKGTSSYILFILLGVNTTYLIFQEGVLRQRKRFLEAAHAMSDEILASWEASNDKLDDKILQLGTEAAVEALNELTPDELRKLADQVEVGKPFAKIGDTDDQA